VTVCQRLTSKASTGLQVAPRQPPASHSKARFRHSPTVIERCPIWGPIFHEVEADQDWGEVRLDAITKYIESIQQK